MEMSRTISRETAIKLCGSLQRLLESDATPIRWRWADGRHTTRYLRREINVLRLERKRRGNQYHQHSDRRRLETT